MFSRISTALQQLLKKIQLQKTNTTMKKYILTIMLFSLGFAGYAQVGIGTASPTLTLEVVGANDNGAVTGVDGVLVPRVNDADMSTATDGTVDGQMVYNTVAKKFYYWNATAWTVVGGVAASTFRTETGNSISDADIGNYVICTSGNPVFDLDNLTLTAGAKITFIDSSSGNIGFTSTLGNIGINTRNVQVTAGGSMVWICDGTSWYLLSH